MRHHFRTGLACLFFVITSCNFVLGQTSDAAAGYDPNAAYARARFLRAKHLDGLEPLELEQICSQAVTQQDINTLLVLASFDSGSVRMQVLKEMPSLPVPMQKQIVVSMLRDDELWNYDRDRHAIKSGFREGQFDEQLEVRARAGRILGRDLRRSSKYFSADIRKQQSAEAVAVESSIMDLSMREQLVNELLAR